MDVKDILEQVIGENFPGVDIVSINAERAVGSVGDDVLEVTVVFRAASDLDAAQVAGLVRHLRPRLMEGGEDMFPIMSFISEKEAGKRAIATA